MWKHLSTIGNRSNCRKTEQSRGYLLSFFENEGIVTILSRKPSQTYPPHTFLSAVPLLITFAALAALSLSRLPELYPFSLFSGPPYLPTTLPYPSSLFSLETTWWALQQLPPHFPWQRPARWPVHRPRILLPYKAGVRQWHRHLELDVVQLSGSEWDQEKDLSAFGGWGGGWSPVGCSPDFQGTSGHVLMYLRLWFRVSSVGCPLPRWAPC